MKKFFGEFKAFISRGNVMDLAVGVIIGSAFTAIVNALVDNLIQPLINLLTGGGADFSALTFDVNGVEFKVGDFISAIINFILIAFIIFLLVKGINKLNKKDEAEPEPKWVCPYCRMPVDEHASKCPNCTADITPEQVQ